MPAQEVCNRAGGYSAKVQRNDISQKKEAALDTFCAWVLDDNDGIGDLHLALTDGVQTKESLADLFRVLEDVGYDGPVSLEMKNDLPDPLDAVTRSYQIITDLMT